MELKPIRTEAEHAEALADIERLWDAPEGSPEADRLEVLAMLVEAYEKGTSRLGPPTRWPSLSTSWTHAG
jgi:antitoxin component HigA of HigAB toxin-antitoxin module